MESETTNPQPMAGSGPAKGSDQPLGVSPGAGFKHDDDQRSKWALKSKVAYWRKKIRAALARGEPAPTPPPEVAAKLAGKLYPGTPPPSGVGAGPSVGPRPPGPDQGDSVQWDTATLKPLFEQLIPALEKADVESLKAKAKKISPDLVSMVERDGKWPEPSKVTLKTSGPQVAAKWLNRSGLKAENAPEVAFAIAAVSIITSRFILGSKLDQMKPKEEPDADKEPEKKADAPR